MKVVCKILFLFLFFCFANGFGIHDSLINRFDFKKGVKSGVNISLGGSSKIRIESRVDWLYYARDDLHIKDTAFRDTNFVLVHQTRMYQIDDDDQNEQSVDFDGFAWYKLYFRIINPAGPVYYLRYSHMGAAEIYFDGRLIQTYGVIGGQEKKGKSINIDNRLIPLYISDTLTHFVAIRYHLNDYKYLYKEKHYREIGPHAILTSQEDAESQVVRLPRFVL